MNYTEHLVDVGDVKINVAEFENNGPPIIFIHGITSVWQRWSAILDYFTPEFHCLAIDLRGHGKSGHVHGKYHRDQYASDVVKLARDYIGKPVYLVGSSLGATTAVTATSLMPDDVIAAVYSDSPLFNHLRPGDHAGDRFNSRVEALKKAKTVDDLVPMARPQVQSEEAAIERATGWLQMDPNLLEMTANGSAVVGWDVEGQLSTATSRALLMQADPSSGGVLDDDEAEKAMGLLPNARLKKWPGVGHTIHDEQPEDFSSSVKEFFSEE